ncbi:large neutral amino acids transporter small subunit 2 [Plakobranchus ocellatus]|uniref:Large neutral amino acids transporter small subunit 2 n=1 Tax=Plakobranchus ocellatus TaxID=259542 RepID=A0AAV4C0C0_9GAST|nr:large neutral amino acids transporter small subunit 2 [Plakobranchus ocellatus]
MAEVCVTYTKSSPRASLSSSSSASSSSSSSRSVSIVEEIRMRQHLSLGNGIGIIVGIIVGSGIFISPKGVVLEAGSVGSSLIIWAISGAICLLGAMCYAELGTAVLKSGADYAYINEAYGKFPAFLYLWVAVIIILPTGNAITALTFANYVLQPIVPTCGPPSVLIETFGFASWPSQTHDRNAPTDFRKSLLAAPRPTLLRLGEKKRHEYLDENR